MIKHGISKFNIMILLEKIKVHLKTFSLHKAGVVIAEFALLMPIFIGALICAMEAQADYYCQSTLDQAVYKSYQQIQNGTAVTNNWLASDFITQALCPYVGDVITCSNLKVNLLVGVVPNTTPTNMGSYNQIQVANQTQTFNIWMAQANNVLTVPSHWCLGAGYQVQLLQVAYPIPFLSAIWSGSLAKTNPYFVTSAMFLNDNTGGTAVTSC